MHLKMGGGGKAGGRVKFSEIKGNLGCIIFGIQGVGCIISGIKERGCIISEKNKRGCIVLGI